MRRLRTGALAVAAALALGALMPPGSPAQTSQPGAPQPSPSGEQATAPAIESVVLARGIKSPSLFGTGLTTPVDETTSFASTDVPYAVVRARNVGADTRITFRLTDPSGAGFALSAVLPRSVRGNSREFDFAAPLYVLGTDLETHVGAWHLQVALNDQAPSTVTFQWTQASRDELSRIKAAVDADPTQPDLRWRYGAALALFGDYAGAIAELRDAIRLDPRYALYHITLGRIYERQGRSGAAVQEFRAALGMHGSYYDAVFSGWARAHLTKLQAH